MEMFCFQCEQTALGVACTKSGVCGKSADTSELLDKLTGSLISLAVYVNENHACRDDGTDKLLLEGMFTAITNVNYDDEAIAALTERIAKKTIKCGISMDFDMNTLWESDVNIRSFKSLILIGMRGMAAYAWHALVLGYKDDEVTA